MYGVLIDMQLIKDYFEANSYLDANIRFRDWKIEVRNLQAQMYCLYVRIRVEDNFNKGNMIDLIHTRPLLPFPMDEAIFVNCVWEQMLAILRHEAGEQFYVKGNLPYNEHDTDMNLHKAILDG